MESVDNYLTINQNFRLSSSIGVDGVKDKMDAPCGLKKKRAKDKDNN
ncbi:9599_t:CDS:2 [Gigaspora margarita]|uniref:9599_t:CDS:1 n=1 Tax=Gigaspora margarita TaxID=4874 RepID=A0ABN7VD85_GIGMA|nr:9599_t:CDS:2 [Gigaspora margarita]